MQSVSPPCATSSTPRVSRRWMNAPPPRTACGERERTRVAGGRRRRCGDVRPAHERSHASLRDDYDVSVPELDGLVELLQAHPSGARRAAHGRGLRRCLFAFRYAARGKRSGRGRDVNRPLRQSRSRTGAGAGSARVSMNDDLQGNAQRRRADVSSAARCHSRIRWRRAIWSRCSAEQGMIRHLAEASRRGILRRRRSDGRSARPPGMSVGNPFELSVGESHPRHALRLRRQGRSSSIAHRLAHEGLERRDHPRRAWPRLAWEVQEATDRRLRAAALERAELLQVCQFEHEGRNDGDARWPWPHHRTAVARERAGCACRSVSVSIPTSGSPGLRLNAVAAHDSGGCRASCSTRSCCRWGRSAPCCRRTTTHWTTSTSTTASRSCRHVQRCRCRQRA